MAVCHRCLLMISIDSRHPELMLDLYISLLSHLALIPGQLKQKVVQLTPFSPMSILLHGERIVIAARQSVLRQKSRKNGPTLVVLGGNYSQKN